MHFGTGKNRDVLCHACRTARRDTLVTTDATRTTRVQGRRHSVDRGWTCPPHFFQKLFLRLMQIQSTKDETCTREHYCFLFVVRHVETSTACSTRTTNATRARHDARDTHYMSRRGTSRPIADFRDVPDIRISGSDYKPVAPANRIYELLVSCTRI